MPIQSPVLRCVPVGYGSVGRALAASLGTSHFFAHRSNVQLQSWLRTARVKSLPRCVDTLMSSSGVTVVMV